MKTSLLNFIENTPNAYICTQNIAKILEENGYKRAYNKIESEKFYKISGDGSVIAADLSGINGFNIVAAHSDSPALKLRPNYDGGEKYLVAPYGGLIYSSWFDRPLGLSGRITVKKGNSYYTKLINMKEPIAVIPSLAIHLNRDVNDGHKFNPQTELMPLKIKDIDFGLEEGEALLSHDLYFYDLTKPLLAEQYIISPRIDDLACVYPALRAFVNSQNNVNARVLAIFNSEEIGSNTMEGADSTFLTDTLSAACEYKGVRLAEMLSSSFMVSADNAHAHHINYPEKSEPDHKVIMGEGIAVKHHANYTTSGFTCALFKDIANVPTQDFAVKNDMRSGSTLGNISLSHLSVNSVDIGVPMLAMHSACETCKLADIEYMETALQNFYNAKITEEKGIVTVK